MIQANYPNSMPAPASSMVPQPRSASRGHISFCRVPQTQRSDLALSSDIGILRPPADNDSELVSEVSNSSVNDRAKRYAVLSPVWVCHYDMLDKGFQKRPSNQSARPVLTRTVTEALDQHTNSRTGSFAMHPNSWKRLSWTIMCVCLLLYDMIAVPMSVFFDVGLFLPVAWFGRFFWTADITVSFFTGVYVNGALRMDFRGIAGAYVKSWFAPDILIVLAEWVQFILEGYVGNSSSMSLLRAVRVLRLVRLLRIQKIRVALSDAFSSSSDVVLLYIGLIKVTCLLLIAAHICAGVWYKIGSEHPDGW